MPKLIQTNTATASARQVPVYIFANAAGDPYLGTLSGVNAALSINNGTENATIGPSADAVRVGGAKHYVQLTQAQVNQTPGTSISLRIPAAAGRMEAYAEVEITEYNFATAPSESGIATAVQSSLAPSFTAIPGAVWTASTRELTAVGTSIREAIADTFLGRSIAGAANGGRTVTSALRMIRNRVTRSGATMSYHTEDDATVFTTAAITTDAGAAPITGIDPA
jgi:hypothetical protein